MGYLILAPRSHGARILTGRVILFSSIYIFVDLHCICIYICIMMRRGKEIKKREEEMKEMGRGRGRQWCLVREERKRRTK